MLNNNLLKSGERPFLKSDLERLNQQAETGKNEPSEAGRSLKSEYDYGSKRKFVDVLGNVNKKNTFNLGGGNQTQDDLKSIRSKYSEVSRQQRDVNKAGLKESTLPSIDEYEEIRLVNAKGETIELNHDQLLYLANLCKEKAAEAGGMFNQERDVSDMTQKELGYEMLKQMKIGEGLTKEQQYELENIASGGVTVEAKQGKKLFRDNMAENSDEFKQLGTLHRDGRAINYFPQETKANFSSRPQNIKADD